VTGYHITAVASSTTAGTVTGAGDFAQDASVNLVATPKAGYRFINWTEGTTAVSTTAAYSFTAVADRSLKANFALIGTPTLSSVVNGGYTSIKLTWTAVTGAASYDIYRATSSTGTFAKLTTVTGTTYTNTSLPAGKYYYYKVRAVATTGVTTTYGSFSAIKFAKAYPATPAVTAASTSYTSVKISWPAVSGANGYSIYRATSLTGTYASLATTTSTSYTNGSLVTGKYYYYKVKAYHLEGTTKVYSALSAAKYAKPIPATPTCTISTKTATKMNISWTTVTGATKYQVYRATSATGTYTLVYTAASTVKSYVNTGLTNGTTYYYKVRAYHLEGTTNIYGACSAVKSLKLGSVYSAGVYKIGTDIPAGEYLFVATNMDYAEFYTTTDAAGTNFTSDGLPYPTCYGTIKSGQYLTIISSKAYPLASAPLQKINTDGSFLPGQYKVGRDIPAGTYVINYQATNDFGYFDIESNSLNDYSGYVGSDWYSGRIYVTLTAGQYFTFDLGLGYIPGKYPLLDKSQPYLYDGMYLVGTDIPAGTYSIEPEDAYGGYYEIYTDATFADASYVDGGDVSAPTSVTVTNGQYLYVLAGKFLQLP
jgi:fibronectin type 3 domain-containing protein